MPKNAFCTIVGKNYLAQARVLMETVRTFDPDCLRIVLLTDRIDGCFDPAQEPFEVILSEDLQLPQSRWFHFKYSILELSTAVKPYLLEFAMQRFGIDRIVYLDPDIKLYASLGGVFRALENHSIVLTPHLTAPLNDDRRPNELDVLRSGAYNLGFIGVARGDATASFLKWWQARLYEYCVVDLPRGLFVDQKWIDLVPGLYPGVCVLRDPGYNVAYWNVAHRKVERSGGAWQVNGEPLYFYHFSGLNAADPSSLSTHQNRYKLAELGGVETLVQEYLADLDRMGFPATRQWPYAFGAFANGTPIPDAGRQVLRDAPDLIRIADPFSDEGYREISAVWNAPLSADAPNLTRIAYRIYRSDEDLKAAMPDVFGGDKRKFLEWLSGSGASASLPEAFAAPAWDALRNPAAEADETSDVPELTRLAMLIHQSRPDLQRTFPDPAGVSAVTYLAWLLTYGAQQYRIAGPYLDPLREQWEQYLKSLPASARLWHRSLLTAMSAASASGKYVSKIRRALGKSGAPHEAPSSPASAPLGFNLFGYFRAETGVGQSGRRIAESARRVGLPINIRSIAPAGSERAQDHTAGADSETLPHAINVFRVNADETPRVFGRLEPALWQGKYNIGCWAWELESFPDSLLPSFAYLDEVWVPSSFCQDAVAMKSPIPVVRMPYSVEVKLDGSPTRADLGWHADDFVFLTVFDMLSVFPRKNPIAVIDAFLQTFADSGRHRLVIKINHPDADPASMQLLREHATHPSITVIAQTFTRAEINGLMNAADCMVSLHRSEGFGWTMAEAMYLGKPVIATAYSGNIDFTQPGCAYLVGYHMVKVGDGAAPYDSQEQWAEPSVQDAVRCMRAVVENRERSREVAARGQALIRDSFSPAAVGWRIRARLEKIRAVRRG